MAYITVRPERDEAVEMLAAYRAEDPVKFATALNTFREATEPGVSATEHAKVSFEVFLNEFAPRYQVIMLYVFAGFLALCGWVAIAFRPHSGRRSRRLRSGSWSPRSWSTVRAVHAHVPDGPAAGVRHEPVLHRGVHRLGRGRARARDGADLRRSALGNLAASVVGGATAIIAHNLAASGDTLEMMVRPCSTRTSGSRRT